MRRGSMTKEAVDQASLALKNFRSLQPTLNRYAQILTGRPDIRVVAATHDNGSTDGKVINYRPPISLGKQLAHQPWLCDRRDELKMQRCQACAQREEVLSTIYHEIAHIWFDSFAGVTDTAKLRAIREAIGRLGTVYGEKVRERIEAADSRIGYMGLAGVVSPFLPLLLNALEDARVNRELFRALPGTKIMFEASTHKIFRDGVEQIGHAGEWTTSQWRDRPLNLQALIGIFCMASGYDFRTWLHEFVVNALSDEKLVSLVKELDDVSNVDSTFSLAFPILARLRELGFCRDDEADPADDFEPPYEEESEPSDTDEEAGDSDSADAEGDTADSGSSEKDAGGGDDSPRSDDRGDGDESGPSNGHDELEQEEVTEDGESTTESGEDGGDSPGDGPAGSEEGGPDASGPGFGGGGGAGDPETESDESGSEPDGDPVPEEDRGTGSTMSSGPAESGDPADLRDGEGSGIGLDGPHRKDRGEPESGEHGDVSGADSGPDEAGDAVDDESGDDESVTGAIDTGERGKGVRVEGELPPPKKPPIPWGEASDAEILVHEIGDHEPPSSVHAHSEEGEGHHTHSHDEEGDEIVKAVMTAGMYFEMPSVNVTDVKIYRESDGFFDNHFARFPRSTRVAFGIDGEFDPPEVTIAPALLRARVVFADNQRGRHERGLRRGRIHTPSLARRVPAGDDRVFQQKRLPGRTDYFVGVGIDVSASTTGHNLELAKKVAFAEAEMLSRLGIPFFMYAHSGQWNGGGGMNLDIVEIKTSDDPWNDTTRNRLRRIGPMSANLDGHTLQFYRKMLERERAAVKILHYYSDGAMPCENFEEELQILTEEVKRYSREGIHLRGVGIRTDAPRQHGLPTVEVREQEDVLKVVLDLESVLTRR